jgi:hypothetical protein
VREFSVEGMDGCESSPTHGDADYRTSTGPMASKVICKRAAFVMTHPVTITWRLRYQPG